MGNRPDWRSPDVARHYAKYDYADFAQAFLRRNPDYVDDYEKTQSIKGDPKRQAATELLAGRWGLIFPFDPTEPVSSQPALWLPSLLSTCVILDNAPDGFPKALSFNIEQLGVVAADQIKGTDRHLVLESTRGHQRIWLHDYDNRLPLAITIPVDENYFLRAAASERFYRYLIHAPQRQIPSGILPTRYQRQRFIQLLFLLDAEKEGKRRREMAYQILYPNHDVPGSTTWKASNERRRFYRMLEDAHFLSDNGYRQMLQGTMTDKQK